MCAVLLFVGCAGVRSGAPQGEQEHTEATNEQVRSPEATASEETRCGETRTIDLMNDRFTTNEVPDCPSGGLLSGTEGQDMLAGEKGDDEIHGLGELDIIVGGLGNDVIYGGPGGDLPGGDEGDDVIYGGDGDEQMWGGEGEDVLYGGDGSDLIDASDRQQRDKLYCGEGIDLYWADKNDYVSSSCEDKLKPDTPKNIHPREA